jgi:hypothetical protein
MRCVKACHETADVAEKLVPAVVDIRWYLPVLQSLPWSLTRRFILSLTRAGNI